MSKENVIRTQTARAKLAHRKAPYWARVSAGLHIGYKTSAAGGAGTWVGRIAIGDTGKYTTTSFDGTQEYDAAVKLVTSWSDSLNKSAPVESHSMTVKAVCQAYIANLKKEKGKKAGADAEGRFIRLVYGERRKFQNGNIREYDGTIGQIVFSKLTPKDVQYWRNNQLPEIEPVDEESYKRVRDSINRNLKALKAALNFGKDVLNLVETDKGWKSINQFPDVAARREGWIKKEERERLIAAMQPDLQVLATALLLIGARPGELASANVSDFDKESGKLVLDGKTGEREIMLSDIAHQFLIENSKGRIGNAPLLITEDSKRWKASVWGRLFKEAREKAKLPDAVMYCMRHTFISEVISQGMNIFEVAKITGTSVEIIESNYGMLTPDTQGRLNKVIIR